jgi:1,4-dihydroxy-2-naphthoate octaprenyltransferase
MSHPIAEPSVSALPHRPARYFAALRPPFLLVALGSCLVGLAGAAASGVPIDAARALVTIVFAMLAQGGANVLNDYYDSVSGNDAANTERVFPFTGGSRMIQNGVLTEAQMLACGTALFGATMAAGLWLMLASGPDLFFLGAAGLFIGWAYSAPPFKLNSRGWGEACIWFAWMLIAAGADYVQRGSPSALPWIASAGYALLVTNILYINQFPDARADALVGKRHWVVRLGPDRASAMYSAIGIGAYACLVAAVVARALPPTALAALLAAPLTFHAARILQRHRHEASRLAPAIQATIAAALAHAALLSLGLWAGRWG